jgi:uncharacterized protein DUF1302
MRRRGQRIWVVVCVMAVSLLGSRARSNAIPLDKEGDIKLGVRTYVNGRIGTEDTHDGVPLFKLGRRLTVTNSATFPHSDAGHLRQNRAFIEVELNHDLTRLLREGVGPLSLLNDLPFKFKELSYHATFRGEGDGLYDWGPKEYSTAVEFNKLLAIPAAAHFQTTVNVPSARRRLRHLGTDRERLFQGYVEANAGDLFVRVGRQILAWGETDAFQLLDHINPIDSSFGGFLVSLDERRVPLDMALANYNLGDFGPISDSYLEGYVAIDNQVGYYPGTPAGSPWALPSLAWPSNATKTFILRPPRTVDNARGGFLLKFNAFDATFSLAHYYTYFDVPAIQVHTSGVPGQSNVTFVSGTRNPVTNTFTNDFREGLPCASAADQNPMGCGYPTHAVLTAPKVQVSGASTTFAVPRFYSVVRSEVAYFKDEPAFTQGQLDPFIFNPNNTGGRRLRDSINAVLGLDMNQWIRFLNPNQTFFITTQFFYKHIKNGAGDHIFNSDGSLNPNREVLPVTLDVRNPPGSIGSLTRVEPIFIQQPIDQYLQTLLITTSYYSGQVSPAFVMFYDWGGGFVYQPSLTISRDPFRFNIDYSIIDSHIYKGGSGVSLLKDRDNIQFRIEYVI